MESKINKQRQKIKKELISFIKYIVIYSIVVALIIYFHFEIFDASVYLTQDNTHTITGVLQDWELIRSGPRTAGKFVATRAYFVIENQTYTCNTTAYAPQELWDKISVGDIVSIIVYDNASSDWNGRTNVSGFEYNGEIYFDIEESNKGMWVGRFVILPIFGIVEIVAGIALIVRVAAFIRTICKRSSMIKAHNTNGENLN